MPEERTAYDVFLSFNSEDRDAVRKIAEYLAKEVKLHPWFDEWDLSPGDEWIDGLYRGLESSAVCAIFVGKNGEGPWQRREIRAALIEQAARSDFRLIPVLLPGTSKQPQLPPFLKAFMWVDLRQYLKDPDGLRRLVCGIRGERPGRPVTAEGEPDLRLHEIAVAYNFDLNEFVNDCLDALWGRRGIVGFGVPCLSPEFLSNVSERLKYELGRQKVRVKPAIVLHPLFTTIEQAILTVSRRYAPALQEGDVLFTVQAAEEDAGRQFWNALSQAVNPAILSQHRLIVLLAVNPDAGFTQDIIPLSQPQFRIADMMRWVAQIVRACQWPEELIEEWTDEFLEECHCENTLRIDWVYDYLEAMLDLLRQKPQLYQFQQELYTRRQRYVQTSL
ncbi:methyltransferase type 11 [Candidatus Vecturithrix granuli]|uniref:Methyltransferase type 11 n=1 Tax=Vecturithrix granuli TaxID=1499967 RepID=A0A081BZ92_VECG1|nr:methyltransferase type 11 [Candidatus Vecturithrix granuli]